MYDNLADPYQLNNLIGKPEYSEKQAQLDAWLKRKLKKVGDRFEPAASYIKRWGYKIDATGAVPYDP